MIDMFQITDPDPGCGLSDWDEVLADYSGLECGAIEEFYFHPPRFVQPEADLLWRLQLRGSELCRVTI